jgi:hypothetical protein
MKRLILFAAIAAMAATPALARSHHKTHHHHYAHTYGVPGGAYGYYAGGRGTSPCVYVNGHYAGCDPDPNVRRSLVDEYYFLHNPFY